MLPLPVFIFFPLWQLTAVALWFCHNISLGSGLLSFITLYFTHHPTGPQGSGLSSRGGRVDQRKGRLEVSDMSALAVVGIKAS